jgi:hypothetical protein
MKSIEELTASQESMANQLASMAQELASMQRATQQQALYARLAESTPLRTGGFPAGASVVAAGTSEPGATSVIAPGAVTGDTIAPGAIDDIAAFAATIRPPVVVTSLPALPNALYPVGSFAFLTTDAKLYRNVAGAWSKAVDGADIVADSITAGQIAAGAIGADEIAAGAITAGKLAVGGMSSRNLLVNGGFRDGLGGWTSDSGSAPGFSFAMWDRTATNWTLPDGDSPTGLGSTSYITGTTTASRLFPRVWQDIAVVPGEWYSYSGLLGVHRLTEAHILLQFLDGAGANVDPEYDIYNPASLSLAGGPEIANWNQMSGSFQVPAGARYVRFCLLGITPNTSDSSWYLFMDQMWVGRGQYPMKYAPQEPQGVSNTTGEVVIDSTGITITNGKFAMQDEFGSSAMVASGFGGDWADYISNGLYNSRFIHGTVGTVDNGRTSKLPYWTVGVGYATLTYFDSGVQCVWSDLSGTAYIESDPVPVQDGQWYSLAWTTAIQRSLGTVRIQPEIHWLDEALDEFDSSLAANIEASASISQREGPQDCALAPVGTRYATVSFLMQEVTTHSASNWARLYGASLRPVVQAMAPQRFSDNATAYIEAGGSYNAFATATGAAWDAVALVQVSCTSNVTLNGILRPTWGKRLLTLLNYSNYTITLKDDSASASATSYRIYTPGGADCVVSKWGAVTLYYNDLNSRWQVVSKT